MNATNALINAMTANVRALEAETVETRAARLGMDFSSLNAKRLARLKDAMGLSDADWSRMACANRTADGETIVLPKDRLEGLSRGKGWARKGKGDRAEWGDRVTDGYLVGEGSWIVGGDDGFKRKNTTPWEVVTLRDAVGGVWTIAE